MNKVSKKKDILTSFILTNGIEEKKYPIDLLEIYLIFTRKNSKVKSIKKNEIEDIINGMLNSIRKNIGRKNPELGTISFEIWSANYVGEHEYSIRIIIVGDKIGEIQYEIYKALEEDIAAFGGLLVVNKKQEDKLSLAVELIPLQVDFNSFLHKRDKNFKDKLFYSDEVLKTLLDDMTVLSKEDLQDPLYRFQI